jgi:hypothetical protein
MTPLSGATMALMAVRWWRRRRRERAIERDLGAANGPESAASARHLTPGLSRVASQGHTLSLVLETPVRRIRTPLLSESPWRRRERCDEYDNVLADVRRAMWEWLAEVERLDEADRRTLCDLGLSLRPFRTFLYFRFDRTNDPWEQVVWAEAPDLDRIHRELLRTILELKRFVRALVEVPVDPYRAAG